MLDGAVDVPEKDQRSICADVVKEGFRFIKEKRKVVFNAGCRDAVFNVFVERDFTRIAFKGFAPARAEVRPRLLVHRKFMSREQADFINFFYRALVIRIKYSDFIEFVIKKVEAIRLSCAHREEVKQSAAAGKLSWSDHL